MTWSINSICHTIGQAAVHASATSPRNVWWLAIPSMGESWHNLHHADPTAARHGVLRGQLDSSARVIWAFESCISPATSGGRPRADRQQARTGLTGCSSAAYLPEFVS